MAKATKVLGVNKLLHQLREFSKEGEKMAAGEVEAAIHKVTEVAKKNAPANDGSLRQVIISDKVNRLNWESVSHAPYSGFVEFGTGAKVFVPKGMEKEAQDAKNAKGGDIKDALLSIKDWCKRKGIDERAAYPILMSILDEGLRPRPFMYPAWIQGCALFEKQLRLRLDQLTKKFNAQK